MLSSDKWRWLRLLFAYRDQKKLGDYIAQISSDDFKSINISGDLRPAFLSLDLMINSNVLLAQYRDATNAFKQTVFPFIERYLPSFNLPENIQLGSDISVLVSTAKQQLQAMRTAYIQNNEAAINRDDEFIITGNFDNRSFNKSFVRSLLRGEPVTLSADITRGLKMNVLKFRQIEMVLRASDAAWQVTLDTELHDFDVKLSHMGNSYYRCDATYFTISNPIQTITYSYKRKANGEPMSSNGVYQKLLKGDFMLSPYAMWTLQLVDPFNRTNSFQKLAKYADHTDVVLDGVFQYASADANICNSDLNKYYQPDRSISMALTAIATKN